ncbi:FIG00388076: hypothetical protein [hydrothermal vent metagenome]|uniref:Formylmethanofuran dehydrogenase subunit E domain-containing protein n=1 Tax=hydrothermal vent metagenome TaxID=652676 RepID=A0A1W1D2X8_9ZZZZ
MNYPSFYDDIPSIKVKDPLADVLGAIENGEYEFTYLDVVKSAGHSCPTVMGAYLLTLEALQKLYPDQRAIRGDIKVEFKEEMTEGVAGVIGNVISHITGATSQSGFKGLGNKFVRHSLMFFHTQIHSSVRFTRIDTNQSVELIYNPSSIPANPSQQVLMQKVLQEKASDDEKKELGTLWQDRVQRIFENRKKVIHLL